MGDIYDSQGKLKEALDAYSKALSIYEKTDGQDSIKCATNLNNIGGVYKMQGKFTEAFGAYNKAISIYERNKER
jgi:tetratricopeptide (TPR) repeat protein